MASVQQPGQFSARQCREDLRQRLCWDSVLELVFDHDRAHDRSVVMSCYHIAVIPPACLLPDKARLAAAVPRLFPAQPCPAGLIWRSAHSCPDVGVLREDVVVLAILHQLQPHPVALDQ